MPEWWAYQEESAYRKRKATDFRTKAEDYFRQKRQPVVPEPEPKKEGGRGGLLGGLKMLGEAGLGVLEKADVAARFATGSLSQAFYEEPKHLFQHPEELPPVRLLTGKGPSEETLALRHKDPIESFEGMPAAAQWTGRIGLDPLNLIGLGVAPKAVKGLGVGAKALGMTKAATRLEKIAPTFAKAEDIAAGGPLIRGAGRAVTAPLRVATRRFAPDVPKVAGIKAKAISEATMAKWAASVKKVGDFLSGPVKKARHETEALYRVERGQRFGAFEEEISKKGVKGIPGAYEELAGELPTAAHYQLPEAITGEDITNILEVITESNIRPADKVATFNAAFEVLGVRRVGGELVQTGAGRAPGLMGIARLEKVLGKEFANAARSQRTLGAQARAAIVEAANLPRAVLAAYDFSAPLRQGLLVPGADFKAWRQGVGAGVRAMFDEKYADDVLRSMREGQTGVYKGIATEKEVLDGSGVYISELGGGLGRTEEQLQSRLAQYLPGIPMSERGYVVPLSKMRHSWLFHEVGHMEKKLGRALDLTDAGDLKALDDIGKVVNAMTGRGNLPEILRGHQGLLSTIFFAPRLLWSRFQVPTMVFTKNAQVRRMVARGVVGAAAANAGILAAAAGAGKAAGWDMTVEHDPRSTDFGKIRVGATRMDFLGGYQPIVRYAAQLISGERKTTVAGEMFPVDPKRVVTDFLRTKLSPIAGVGTDVITGETMLGDPMSGQVMMKEGEWEDYLQNHLVPMFIQDMKEAVAESGLAPGAFLALPGAFGGSVMSYAWPAQKLDALSQETMGKKWKDLGTVQRREFLEKNPEAQEIWIEYIEMNARRGQDWAEGLWESLESYSEVEARLSGALASGADKATVAADYEDFRESMSFDGDPDREPRDEQEKRMMDYYAIRAEDYRNPDGTTDFESLYQAKRDYIVSVPETQEDFSRNEVLKWQDPTMRAFVQEYQRASDLWGEYYEMPSKLGMDEADQREARRIQGQITTLQFMNPGMSAKQALMQLDLTASEKMLWLRYQRLPSNPAREQFRAEYGTEMALIKPPQFGGPLPTELVE